MKEYDYSQTGGYFITVCTEDRECLFGEIVDGAIELNETGQIIKQRWMELPSRYSMIELDEFIVMPNHIHGIVLIFNDDEMNHGKPNVAVGAIHELPLRVRPSYHAAKHV